MITTDYTGIYYPSLEYNTREINQNFKIKVSGKTEGRKIHKLVGVSGLIDLIGSELCNTLIKKAFSSDSDKVECKLRRGLKVIFYAI